MAGTWPRKPTAQEYSLRATNAINTDAINSKWDFKSEWKYNRGLPRSGLL